MNQRTSGRAVVASVVREGDQYRIVLDDAVRENASPSLWRRAEHFTNTLVPANKLRQMEFTEQELADFGAYVLARLNAFVSRDEN